MNCADCRQKPKNRCNTEGFDCTGGKLDLSDYKLKGNQNFQNISDQLRAGAGDTLCRIEEIIRFSEASGFKKLGIAFCIGLADEAYQIASIFKQHFRVESSCCKMSGLDKKDYDMIRIAPGGFEVACNPIGQARILNRAKTDLNIQLGLCIGHDILFQKYSEAPVTVLAVKDRVLANNPLGAIYSSYWRKRLGKLKPPK
jgi:uncharacterized metal-binding protein